MLRRFRSRLGIRGQVILIVLATSFAGFVVGGFFTFFYEVERNRENLRHEYLVLTRIIAGRSTAALTFKDIEVANENLQNVKEAPDFAGGCIYDEQGEIFVALPDAEMCPQAVLKELWYYSENFLHIFSPVLLDRKTIGAVYLRVHLSRLAEAAYHYSILVVIMICILMILSYLLSFGLQHVVTRPITKLWMIAHRVSEERDYSLRGEKVRDDEVGKLVDAFNTMLDTIREQHQELENSKQNLERLVDERTAELQRTNDELKSFSYSVSHDLRAPLRSINGFSAILMEDCQDKLNKEDLDYLLRIRNAGTHMGKLIDSLLALSRLTNKELIITQVDMTKLAEEYLAQLRGTYPEREVEVIIAPNMQERGDATLLRSVYENLIDNAWKYTSKVDKPRIEVAFKKEDSNTVYFVRDNGSGFNMQYAGKLFGAFQRLHPEEEFPGTGIGLATVKRIIHRHGGRVWAEAEVNKGATFYFTLSVPSNELL